jgi:hypothetical protein
MKFLMERYALGLKPNNIEGTRRVLIKAMALCGAIASMSSSDPGNPQGSQFRSNSTFLPVA